MKAERCTIYFAGEMMGNFHRIECRSAETTVRAYAQYSSAVQIRYTQKGCRSVRGFVQSFKPSLVILDGWGHPAPDGIFDEAAEEKISEDVSFTRGRHSGCSDGWAADFGAMLEKHVAETGAKILADFRGHNPHAPLEAEE